MNVTIFDIQRFCLHDGPGIRTTVFLKGCHFRCPWCANPESQSFAPQLMFMKKKCRSSGKCAEACPEKAITLVGGKPVIDRNLCTNCGLCCKVCVNDALVLSGRSVPTREIIAIALKDRDYYLNSAGGITFSGGEPFTQFDGLFSLLTEAKAAGLDTSCETTGDVDIGKLKETIPLVDHYLVDFKHSSLPDLARIGISLPSVLQSIEVLRENCPEKLQIRTPLIPGYNDSREAIEGIAGMLRDLKIPSLEFLKYHKLGVAKYEYLGRAYPFSGQGNEASLNAKEIIEIGKGFGLTVKVS